MCIELYVNLFMIDFPFVIHATMHRSHTETVQCNRMQAMTAGTCVFRFQFR